MVKEPVRTFSVGFDEREANELAYARLAARAVGAEHREVVVSPGEFFEALPRLVWHEDEPIAFPSSVPLYFVSRLARDHVKVVLTGEGADELFLGYNRYRVTAWNERLGRPYWALTPRPLRAGASRRRRPTAAAAAAPLRGADLPGPASPGRVALFYENFAVFPGAAATLLADRRGWAGAIPTRDALGCYEDGAGGALDRMSRADLQTYLVELLMKQDR